MAPESPSAEQHPSWTGTRVAHPTGDLARAVPFYRDLLGLPKRGGFENHNGYDGVFFALPGGGELEITAGPDEPNPGTDDDLLVLYLRSPADVDAVARTLEEAGVPSTQSPNPYWNRWGRTFMDPDGFRVVIAARDLRPEPLTIAWHDGPHAELRELFELAEDSVAQLDAYLEKGRVLVASRGAAALGHLQLVPTSRSGEIELKNMAVRTELQGTGVGRALVVAALEHCTIEGWASMLVATAAADVGNLRFYQRVGFRMLSVERDAFIPATGYPDPIELDGIMLRDRIWLSIELIR
jgi:predicted N-acetyltransferase YhbS/predicted enzyme related to lactoylglutathione lyase